MLQINTFNRGAIYVKSSLRGEWRRSCELGELQYFDETVGIGTFRCVTSLRKLLYKRQIIDGVYKWLNWHQ